MSPGQTSGGAADLARPIHAQDGASLAQSNSFQPSGFTLEPSELSQAMFDVFVVLGFFLAASLSGIAFMASVFYFLFVA
jgi:hypothetical protein